MNERLKQEIRDYIGAQKSDVFRDVAGHFYNLALEDVRKEVDRQMRDRCDKEGIIWDISGYRCLKNLFSFIGDLTK